MSGFDRARYRRELLDRRAAERYDVLEPPAPKRGCNAHDADGNRCGRWVAVTKPGPFSIRRLCTFHDGCYREHDAIVRAIHSFPNRPWKR